MKKMGSAAVGELAGFIAGSKRGFAQSGQPEIWRQGRDSNRRHAHLGVPVAALAEVGSHRSRLDPGAAQRC